MIELSERNEQREYESIGSGSGSLQVQEANRSLVRLRKVPRDVGYVRKKHLHRIFLVVELMIWDIVSSPQWATCESDQWAKIQEVASIIVALNVTTLKVLEDGWFGPQVIDRCHDKYERLLTQDEVDLVDQIPQDGGVFFTRRCEEYINKQDREQTVSFLTDTRTSDFYPLLFNVAVKLWQVSAAHSELVKNRWRSRSP
jgi:hypothetical protein